MFLSSSLQVFHIINILITVIVSAFFNFIHYRIETSHCRFNFSLLDNYEHDANTKSIFSCVLSIFLVKCSSVVPIQHGVVCLLTFFNRCLYIPNESLIGYIH